MSYSKLNFKANPFAEEKHDFKMIGRKKDWEEIESTLEHQLQIDSHGIIAIFGSYGVGKTFTLKSLERSIEDDSIRIDTNGKTLPIFLKVVETQIPKDYLSNLLIRIIKKIGKEKLLEIFNESRPDGPIDFKSNLGSVLHNLDKSIAWKWLTAKSVSASEMKDLGVDYKITDPAESLELFEDFLRVLNSGGYNNMILLLDDLEFLMAKGGRDKILQIVHEIQLLWDSFNEMNSVEREKICSVIFVLAASIDSWQRFLDMAEEEHKRTGGGGTETFLRRVKGKIQLSPLTTPQIKEFLKMRLDAYRITPSNDLSPFSEDYVKFISEVSFGVPSKVLNFSDLILETAIKKNISTIDKKYGEKVLLEHSLLEEFEEVASV